MSRYPDWATDGRDWPNREASSIVREGGYEWHVQMMGSGPVCLLLHGTGAATHSWRTMPSKIIGAGPWGAACWPSSSGYFISLT